MEEGKHCRHHHHKQQLQNRTEQTIKKSSSPTNFIPFKTHIHYIHPSNATQNFVIHPIYLHLKCRSPTRHKTLSILSCVILAISFFYSTLFFFLFSILKIHTINAFSKTFLFFSKNSNTQFLKTQNTNRPTTVSAELQTLTKNFMVHTSDAADYFRFRLALHGCFYFLLLMITRWALFSTRVTRRFLGMILSRGAENEKSRKEFFSSGRFRTEERKRNLCRSTSKGVLIRAFLQTFLY